MTASLSNIPLKHNKFCAVTNIALCTSLTDL